MRKHGRAWMLLSVRIAKQILWSLLAFVVIAVAEGFVVMVLHPVGGGEFHEIFAYSSGGRLGMALRVLAEYVGIASAITFLLVFFRYPAHWVIVTGVASFIAWSRWSQVCFFPYQSADFHRVCTPFLLVIPPVVVVVGFLAHLLSCRVFPRRRPDGSDQEPEDPAACDDA